MANAHPVRIKTDDGWQDLALTGPQGPQGIPGAVGATGPAGAPGTPGTPALPTPIVNGRWLKGVGGAAVWAPAHYFNSSVDASASNVDIPWNGGEAIIANLALQGGSTSGSIRSVAAPNSGNGTRLVLYNDIPAGKTTTILHSTIGGSGSTLRTRDKVSLVLNPGESVEFIYQYDAFWVEVSRDMHISDSDVPAIASGGRLGPGGPSKDVPGADLNLAVENGWYQGAPGVANSPTANWFMLEVMQMNVSSNVRQRLFEYISENVWMRRRQDGNWGAWYQVYPTPLVTVLPTSPVNGQEVILVDAISNPSYTWRFRYNASSSNASKWEFIGGNDVIVNTSFTTTNDSSWHEISTMRWLVPRAGEYIFDFRVAGTGGDATATMLLGIFFNAAIAAQEGSQMVAYTNGNWTMGTPPIMFQPSAGVIVAPGYWANGGVAFSAYNATMRIVPKRIQ